MKLSGNLGTAIVTGASSGIGKLFADRLAARGYDLVLVARREDRLRSIAADLQSRFSVRADVLVADLSEPAGVASVSDRISSDSSVSMLVNNAGYSTIKTLAQTPDEVIANMIALNITALTTLSKAAIVRFTERGAGTVVNVGSGAGFAPFPGIGIPVYASTKAYVFLLTKYLQNEVEGTGVSVRLVLPGAVVSEGWEVAGGAELEPLPDAIVMTTEDCVDAVMSGLDQGEPVIAPSLADLTLLEAYDSASGTLLQSMFSAHPATRYGLGK
ncbi:hypothetical protein CAF53_19885 [Sphingobium sp. LB126]|nr:hypothetical protein CAF53_19885 [Sphingobium sp. LB126]